MLLGIPATIGSLVIMSTPFAEVRDALPEPAALPLVGGARPSPAFSIAIQLHGAIFSATVKSLSGPLVGGKLARSSSVAPFKMTCLIRFHRCCVVDLNAVTCESCLPLRDRSRRSLVGYAASSVALLAATFWKRISLS
jgi:hypothetical protein